jgi:peptidoglycan hydrolase-like protein with peptidoglycan-binding domain
MAAPKVRVQYKEPFDKKLRNDQFGNMAPYRSHPHRGTDWSPKELSPIPSAAAGKVTQVFWSNVLGWVVEILHADGVYFQYCHIAPKTVCVDPGEQVKLGQIIGKVGGGKKTPSGSASTGAHLHLGASRVKNGHLAAYDKLMDPTKWIVANLAPVDAPAAPAAPATPIVTSAETLAAAVAPDAPVATPAPASPATPASSIDYVDSLAEEMNLDIKKYPKLVPGAKNRYVAYVQKKLKLPVTGEYDKKTVAAVIALQKKNHFVADGVFGKLTWNKIVEL